jgi:hypothetical protein
MSAPRKLNSSGDRPLPPLTRLKQLPLADREIVYGWCLDPAKKLQDVRGEIRDAYEISLSSDSQLSRFKDWQYLQQHTERLNNWTEELEERLKEFNPSASRDQVRGFLIDTLMKEAAASGDQKLALEILDRDLADRSAKTKASENAKKIEIAQRRLALLEKQAEQANAAKAVTADTSLTPAEREAKYKQIFGMS